MFIRKVINANKKVYSLMPHQIKYLAQRHMLLLGLTGILEITFLGALIPLMGGLTNEPAEFNPAGIRAGIDVSPELSMIILALLAFVVNLMRMLLVKSTASLAYTTGELLNEHIFRAYIDKPYANLAKEPVDGVLSAVLSRVQSLVTSIIQPSLTLVGNLVVSCCLICVLVYKSPLVTAALIILVSIFYLAIFNINKAHLQKNGAKISENNTKLSFLLRSMRVFYIEYYLGGRLWKIGSEFTHLNKNVKAAEASNMFLTQSPRYIFEGAFFVCLFLSFYFIIVADFLTANVIGTILLFVVAGMRLFPLSQQTYFLLASMRHGLSVFDSLAPLFGTAPIEQADANCPASRELRNFKMHTLELEKVSVDLPNGERLKPVSFSAQKGDFIILKGESGIGKTTLLKSIIGLNEIGAGKILINGKSGSARPDPDYLRAIGYVPQVPLILGENLQQYFLDDNPNYDEDSIIDMLEAFGISINQPLVNSEVVEFGENLSGGERQRMALVKNLLDERKTLLLLDEFTSALDVQTQEKVLSHLKLQGEAKIIITVSHRDELMQYSTRVVQLKKEAVALG